MARILITGGSSYLGQHLVPLAAPTHDAYYTFYEMDRLHLPGGYQLDVRDEASVSRLIATLQPEIIIHTVGSNRGANMSEVIVDGTTHIVAGASEAGARLIHISTDVIFDGRQAPYDEFSPPTPIHEYGRAKAAAEEIVRQHLDHAIIRPSLIYGLEIMDRGTEWLVQALREHQPVTLFTDQMRNPVWVQTLCQACLELAVLDFCGILNVAGRQAMSRADFGLRMLDWWQIEGRETLSLGESEPDRWPVDCTLDLTRAESMLETPLLGVDEVLASH
jgi:dTDP-4-dehydrorhamnose reductase